MYKLHLTQKKKHHATCINCLPGPVFSFTLWRLWLRVCVRVWHVCCWITIDCIAHMAYPDIHPHIHRTASISRRYLLVLFPLIISIVLVVQKINPWEISERERETTVDFEELLFSVYQYVYCSFLGFFSKQPLKLMDYLPCFGKLYIILCFLNVDC